MNAPGSENDLISEFLTVVEDVSQYLARQKALGNTDLTISDSAASVVAGWGKRAARPANRPPDRPSSKPPGKPSSRQPVRPNNRPSTFACQGPDTARVWLLDSFGGFFSGEAGTLLTKILAAMKLTPASVFICNATDPASVRQRIAAHRPGLVICLGEAAAKILIRETGPLEKIRGRFHAFSGIPVMPTFHPRQLLENPALKRPVWEDMQQVMKQMQAPGQGRGPVQSQGPGQTYSQNPGQTHGS